MRRISFGKTIKQFLAGEKTVTRRLGWLFLKPGTRLLAVNKVMGFRKGEHPQVLGVIQVISVRRERLDAITAADVVAEGFLGWSAEQFITFFCRFTKVQRDVEVTRIEFRRVAENEQE